MKKAITNISISVLFILLIVTLIISPTWVRALEVVRQKNVETIIVFPIQGTGGDAETGLAGMDTESDYWDDGTNPDGFTDSTEPTEIGATGIYYIALTTDEMNSDYIAIQVISGSEDTFIPAQFILIRTMVGPVLNAAVTDDGGAINVTGGAVDTVTTVTNQLAAATIGGAVWDVDIVGAHDTAETAGALLDSPGDWATATNVTVDALAANVITSASINDGAITDADVANDVQVDVLTIKTVNATDALNTAADTVTVTDIDTASLVKVWAYSTRELTQLSDIVTTVVLDATTIGTVENVPAVDVVTIETVDATDQLDTAADTVTVTSMAANVITDASMDPDVNTLINDEMKDVLLTDTAAEPGQGAPPAEPTIEQMIHYLYKYFRNKIVTSANTIELYNDAGAVVDQKAAISDDGSEFTRTEMETGP